MEPVTEGGWSGNASGDYSISHMSPFKTLWLIVGRTTIQREDLPEKTPVLLAIAKIGGGWTPCPKWLCHFSYLSKLHKYCVGGRSFLRLSMKKVECLNILKAILRWTTTKEDPTFVATTDGTQWASRLTILLKDDDNYQNCDTDDNDVNVDVILIDDT